MLKLINGCSLICLLLISSCLDHDLTKLSSNVDAELGLAIPLIHSTTTLGDLLPENENMTTDGDGLIRIAYRQDSIAEILSDSLLMIENQEPTLQEFTIGTIELPDFTTEISVVMSDLTSNLDDQVLSGQITDAIDYSQIHGSAYFPPINPQSGGVYSTEGSDEFQSVLITEGTLAIQITNNLAIELSQLSLRLSNAVNDSEVGVFEFSNILAGSMASSSVELAGVSLHNDLEMEIVNLSSPGTGLDPSDMSSWVSISNLDELQIAIEGMDLVATQGMVKFPVQAGPDSTFVVEMDFEDGAEIDFIDLSAGQFFYSFESDLNTTLELTLEIPQLVDENNSPFSQVISIVNTGLVTNSISLENYQFDFSNSINQLQVNYSSQILATQNFVSYDADNQISLSVGMEELEFELIQGYFGQLEEVIEPDVLDLDLSALSDIASGIVLESPSLVFTTDNSIGIPFEIDIELIGENDGEQVSLNGPELEVASEQISINTFDNSNSELSSLISLNPTTITYNGSVVSNPQGNTGTPNTLSPGSAIVLGFEMDLPLHLRIDDATTRDTLILDFEPDIDVIESVQMQLHVQNEFPLDVDLTMFFQDSISGIVMDSLNVELLQAAIVNENDETSEPNIYDNRLSLSSSQFDALLNSNRTILDIQMSSYDNDYTAVKLYTDYQFIIDAGVVIKLKTEE